MVHEERRLWGYQMKFIDHFVACQYRYRSILTDKQSWRKAPVHESCGVKRLVREEALFCIAYAASDKEIYFNSN